MTHATLIRAVEPAAEANSRDEVKKLVLVGLDATLAADFVAVARRVVPGASLVSVRGLEEVHTAALADGASLLVVRCGSPDDPVHSTLRALRRRGLRTPAILLVPTAAAASAAAFRQLGAVDLLPEEGFTAFDLQRALVTLEAAAELEERALDLLARLQESERSRLHFRRGLHRLTHQLALLEVDDELTGWRAASSVLARMEEEVRRARGYQIPLACLLLSIEDFEGIRQRFDPAFADFVLVQVAHRVKRSIRARDLLARYGEHQFVLLSPFTTQGGALAMAERLRAAAVADEVERDANRLEVSLSVGLAFLGERMQGARDLIAAAAQSIHAAPPAEEAAIEAA